MPEQGNRKSWTLAELAGAVGGEVEGEGSIRVTGAAGLREAGEGEISFLANPKYRGDLRASRAAAVILPPGISAPMPAIRCAEPYLAFARILTLMQEGERRPLGVSPDLVQGEGCVLGRDLSIHAGVILGRNVRIGDRATLHAGVVIGDESVVGEESVLHASVTVREGVRIGKRVIIHCGAVIGSDGFGFAPDRGRYVKVPQTGGVRIGDDVEIGANTTIDRGTLGDTVIGRGTKIDNLVQIAHNVEIGEDCIIVAQVGISGSAVVGDRVTLAGQVGVAGHLRIGEGATVGAQSGITKNIPPGRTVAGLPAIDHRTWLKAAASLEHLPRLRREVDRLRREVNRLRQGLSRGEENVGDQ